MPQQRQRIVFCDCLDCVQQPATTDVASSSSPANEAAAKQEPPPKCLMFVLSGVLVQRPVQASAGAETVLDAVNLPHLNRATAQGNLCLLTVRQSSPADCCSELAQLLNVYEELEQKQQPTSLADKFKGMQASFASTNSSNCDLAASCGLTHSSVLDSEPETAATTDATDADEPVTAMFRGAARQRHGKAAVQQQLQLPDPAEAARRILSELGVQQAEAGLDMMIVHLDANSTVQQREPAVLQAQSEQQQEQQGNHSSSTTPTQQSTVSQTSASSTAAAGAVELLAWFDRTLRYLNNSSAFKDAVLLTVVATPGNAGPLQAAAPMLEAGGGATVGELAATAARSGKQTTVHTAAAAVSAAAAALQAACRPVQRPLQSWQQLGGSEVKIDPKRPLLCMRRLPGVIRRDACSRFSLQECCSGSGVLGLLADRLIPEIAYKLGRAPKYGA